MTQRELPFLLPHIPVLAFQQGCLYIKKLADVDKKILKALIGNAVAHNRARKDTRHSA